MEVKETPVHTHKWESRFAKISGEMRYVGISGMVCRCQAFLTQDETVFELNRIKSLESTVRQLRDALESVADAHCDPKVFCGTCTPARSAIAGADAVLKGESNG